MKRTKPGRPLRLLGWAVGVVVALLGLAAFVNWQLWGLQVTHTTLSLAKLPRGFDGTTIVHLSDLHGHEYGADSTELLALVEEQHPHYIFLTGDVIDQPSQLELLPALARGLCAIAPTYYVTGNHEWATGEAEAVKGILSQCGVEVLSNQGVLLEQGGDQVILAGVDDPNGYADQTTPQELYDHLHTQHPDLMIWLLAHRNDEFATYAGCGYDLVFSGHAHGGIVRLPFTDGLLSTRRTFFPTWTSGEYHLEDSTLFVSRGLGNNTTPIPGFRLFNRPEVAVVTLACAS